MYIYLYVAISILVIIHSKAILIKTIQTTFILFNQFDIIVSKHKSILSELILSQSILLESILSKVEPNTHIIKNFEYSFLDVVKELTLTLQRCELN